VSTSPSFTNGLSNPETTFSQSGQLLARTSSSSALKVSAFFCPSLSFPALLPPPAPMPGIQVGAETTEARASGMIRSRSRSPAERILRPREFAARVPFCNGFARLAKLAESNVRCEVGCRACGWPTPAGVGFEILPRSCGCTSSFCKANIRLKACAGRYSFACSGQIIRKASCRRQGHSLIQ
jgi:hypothetical protein